MTTSRRHRDGDPDPRRRSCRRATTSVLAVLLWLSAGCTSEGPDDAPSDTPQPTATASADTAAPASSGASPGADATDAVPDDGGPTQDVWLLHELEVMTDDGPAVDVLADVTALAEQDLGRPIALTGGATFRPSTSLEAGVVGMDGASRDGIVTVAGMLENGPASVLAVVATPTGPVWPSAVDYVTVALPDGVAGVGAPVVAASQFLQVLPAPVSADEDRFDPSGAGVDDTVTLLASRLAAGTYRYPARADGSSVVFVEELGEVVAADAASVQPASGRVTGPRSVITGAPVPLGDLALPLAIHSAAVGIPAKGQPMVDSIGSGVADCDGFGVDCVETVLDSIEGGAEESLDLINSNFPPDPPPAQPSQPELPDFGTPDWAQPSDDPDPPSDPPGGGEPPAPPTCGADCGSSFTDPHLKTFDDRYYDLMLVGEFVLARSDDVQVQVRTAPAGSSRTVSLTSAVATEVGGVVVEVSADRTAPVLIEGRPVVLPEARRGGVAIGDVDVTRIGGGVLVRRAGEPVVHARFGWDRIDVFVTAGDGSFEGLLGDNDDDPDDDLRARDGSLVEEDAPNFYAAHGDTWRVSDQQSLFTYGPGESTATFTDRSFPDRVVTLASLDGSQRALARRVCEAVGVTGPVLEACILDFATTGDTSLVRGTQAVTRLAEAAELADPGSFVDADDKDATLDADDTATATGVPVTGLWDTSYGPMDIEVDGEVFRATYSPESENGTLVGERVGRAYTGTWVEPSSLVTCDTERRGSPHWGSFEFVFAEDGRSFEGLWSYCDGMPNQEWDGRLEDQ